MALYTFRRAAAGRNVTTIRSIELECVYRKPNTEMQQYVGILRKQRSLRLTRSSMPRQQIGDYFAACGGMSRRSGLRVDACSQHPGRLTRCKAGELPSCLIELHASMFTSGLLSNSGSQQDAGRRNEGDRSGVCGRARIAGSRPSATATMTDGRKRALRGMSRKCSSWRHGRDRCGAREDRMRIVTALRGRRRSLCVEQRYPAIHRATPAPGEGPAGVWTGARISRPLAFKPVSWLQQMRSRSSCQKCIGYRHRVARGPEDVSASADAQAPYLSKPFVDQDFRFNSRTCAVA